MKRIFEINNVGRVINYFNDEMHLRMWHDGDIFLYDRVGTAVSRLRYYHRSNKFNFFKL